MRIVFDPIQPMQCTTDEPCRFCGQVTHRCVDFEGVHVHVCEEDVCRAEWNGLVLELARWVAGGEERAAG